MKDKIARHYNISVPAISLSICVMDNFTDPEPVMIRLATKLDSKYAFSIVREMSASALTRGIVIAYCTVESICEKWNRVMQ